MPTDVKANNSSFLIIRRILYKNNPEIKKIKKVAMCFEINKPPYSLIFKLLAITSENKNCIGWLKKWNPMPWYLSL